MPVTEKFFTGNLNLDASKYRIPAGDYMDALNLTRDSQGDYTDGPFSNLVGNTAISYADKPDGDSVTIGAFPDRIRNRVIYFNWNSLGYHGIYTMQEDTRVVTKIFESITDSGGIDILNFQVLYKVNDINVIHRDEDGDLLLWNDGFNRPGQLNIADFVAGIYIPVSDDLIRLDRMPPIDEPTAIFSSDNDNYVNNFRKKLFQFAYAYRYANIEKSTLSPISKIPIADDAYSVSVDSAPNKNNQIIITVVGGPADSKSIILYGRQLAASNVFSDWFKIDELNNTDYNILPGVTYDYTFVNDGQYITEDVRYTDLSFVRSADKCNAQTVVNGNVIVQGGITDGYDAIQRDDVNVQITSTLVDTEGNSVAPHDPSLDNFAQGVAGDSYYITWTVGADVGEGSVYSVKFRVPIFDGPDYSVDVTYIASGTDTALDVATALEALISPQLLTDAFSSVTAPNRFSINGTQNRPRAYPFDQIVYSASPQQLKSGGSPTWKWNEKIRIGIVYKDKYGKSNGVVSYVSTADDPTDFSVTTNDFAFNNNPASPYYGNPQIPVIQMSINSIPPSWAESYTIVRTRNQSVSSFLQYITCETNSDANYFYFCIQNLTVFIEKNTGFVPSYTFQSGDRVRVYAEILAAPPNYSIPATIGDYEIVGTITKEMTGGTEMGLFLKVKKPLGAANYGNQIMIEIYRPSLRQSDETQVFYTFGETYPIYTGPGGIRYHVGENQNQTATQPATFTFEDGDVYYKFRDFYPLSVDGAVDFENPYARGVMDANYSDYWNSAVNSDGTPWVIELNAQRLYRPTQIRFGQANQPGTNLNGLNIFYPEDFIENIRDNGDIMRMLSWNNGLIVCQQFKIGVNPVFQQMTFNEDGSSNLILSSKLLNRVQYFRGEYGIGTAPESLAWNNYSIYGCDNKRGVIWQLKGNELVPISIIHNVNNFTIVNSKIRGFDDKIYGGFDAYLNQYVIAFSEIPARDSSSTLIWNENRNGFESFVRYDPEYITCLNTLLVTFKNGVLYTHDNQAIYNYFYGRVYSSSVQLAFNENPLMKKTWQTVMLQSNVPWEVQDIQTSVISHGTTYQLAKLFTTDFVLQEDFYQTSFLRDLESPGKAANGDVLKGAVMTARFYLDAPNALIFINSVVVEYDDSSLNVRK